MRPFLLMTLCLPCLLAQACDVHPGRRPPSATLPRPAGSVLKLPPSGVTGSAGGKPYTETGTWPCFGADCDRTGSSRTVRFPSADLVHAWTYSIGRHVYRYREGTNLWSESPVTLGTPDGRVLVAFGTYDRKVHCLDGATGERQWRFTTGDEIVAAPCWVSDVLVVPSSDRCWYGLSADGDRLWVDEHLSWSHTVSPSVDASPTFFKMDGKSFCAGAYFVNDQAPARRIQDGYAAVWKPATGKRTWTLLLRHDVVYGPAVGSVRGRRVLFYATGDGVICAVGAVTGKLAWTRVTDERIRSCPVFALLDAGPTVFATTRWGMLWAFDALDGSPRWSYRAGHMADGSPALAVLTDGRPVILFGTYDRCLHCVDTRDGKRLWKYTTGDVVLSSPAVAMVGDRPAVFFQSMDNGFYCLDAATGDKLWSFFSGPLPWPYFKRGDAVFGSPAVYEAGGKPMVVFEGNDGKLYAFTANEATP